MRLPPLKAVWYFESAARNLSFSRAAEELNVTHSAISHQIKALEEWLGATLFERGARTLQLTEAGRRLAEPARSAFRQLAKAAQEVKRDPAGDAVTVSAMPSLTVKWLVPRLYDFRKRHPDIEVRISATEKLEPVGEGDIDLGIRYGKGSWPPLAAELLLEDEIFPVAAPKLLAERGHPESIRDLARYPLISDSDWRHADFDFWPLWLEAAGVADLELKANLKFNFSNLMVQAAVDGLGVGLGNSMLTRDDLAAGRLVRLFDLTVRLPTGYYLVYGKGALKQPKVKAFRDWLVEQVGGMAG